MSEWAEMWAKPFNFSQEPKMTREWWAEHINSSWRAVLARGTMQCNF